MKLREVYRFELAYQVRRPWTWLIFALLVALSFLFVRVNFIGDALYTDLFLNSPFLIAGATVYGGLLWLLLNPIVAGEAAARDVATGMHPLTYTSSLTRWEYLGGRFLAAFTLNAALLLGVQLGILLAIRAPGVHPEAAGPFRLAAYLTAYGCIALPNAFLATALQYTVALRSGRAMTAYLGSLFLIFMGFFVATILLYHYGLGSLLDPTGVRFIAHDLAHRWTTIEQNTRLVWMEGTVLQNRLLWISVALGSLGLTYVRFGFAHRPARRGWIRRSRQVQPPLPSVLELASRSTVNEDLARAHRNATRHFGTWMHLRQTIAIAWESFRSIARSWAGFALLVFIPLLTIPVVLDQVSSSGTPLAPTTIRVIGELTGSISDEMSRWVIIPLFIVFFAGELVWRERETGADEITDTMPGSEWPPLLGKLLGLTLILVLFTILQSSAGVAAQTILGFDDIRLSLYLKILMGLQLTEYLLFAVLALAIHVLVNQKYLGHLAAIVAYVFIALAAMFGVEHDLLIYAASPAWSWTEMRGFDPSLVPWLWFKSYWAAWALVLAVVARLFWVRGKQQSLAVRLRSAARRMARPTAVIAVAGAVLVFALGGFIFYNTNVLNRYVPRSEIALKQARYEQLYGQYRGLSQPRLASARLHIEIYPDDPRVDIRGTYDLLNLSDQPVESIHISTPPGVDILPLSSAGASDDSGHTISLGLNRSARLHTADSGLGYSIHHLADPLIPGESIQLKFDMRIEPRGFPEHGLDDSLVANGTRFNDSWLPSVGYQPSRELITASDRREHGLDPQPLVPSLDDAGELPERGQPIRFEAVVGTSEDQIAVAPGELHQTWSRNGRNYFHYKASSLGSEWGFYSADYRVLETRWEGSGRPVEVRIHHHPEHTGHLLHMVDAIHASLDYYTEHFGPYEHSHLTVVESPGNGVGMHADASQISHSEGFTEWRPAGEHSLDMQFATVAHEMAHQWTVPYAFVEGAPVLSESIAWYYAMKVVEESLGRDHLHRLLDFMRQPHPIAPIRRGEPLLRGLDPYMSYRRGPFALFALSEYIGADRVNAALRKFRETHEASGAPLATTLDLYRELKTVTPEPMQYLLHDLFEVNTLWELHAETATARKTAAGEWEVSLEVTARKYVFDEAGVETDVPMDEPIEIGVFGAPESGEGPLSNILYREKHRVRSGAQTITVTVKGEPHLAGIDPYHLLDWEEGAEDASIASVTIEK